MDGMTATRRLRDMEGTANTPIIALTALAMPSDRERCLAAGASDYLAKPIRLVDLTTMIERWLRPNGQQTAAGSKTV
jgi:CheY-like chemotaxis protein